MAEALSEAIKSTGVKILWKPGGEFFIDISTDNVVAKEVCKTAIKLSALYVGYQLLRPVIDAAVKKALGGERDDQEVKDIKPGSLHVVLHCFTDERFLAVLTDYLSGKMKERLQEEFLRVEIKVNGLKVEIQNMVEVNEIKEAICKRNLSEDVKNAAMDDAESDIKKNVDEMKVEFTEVKDKISAIEKKQDEGKDEMKVELTKMKDKMTGIEGKQDCMQDERESQMSAAVRKKQDEIINDLDEIKIVSMAARLENVHDSYDVTRFVGEVQEDLLCLICKEVPQDPRLCKNKDHIFCLAHISRHLQNSQTCPYCRDLLTLETLRRPTGFLKNYLDEMKIKCDHHDRGCPEVLRLEYLPRHVDQCEFAPVTCGNEGCETVVNKSEKENHEKYLCKFRIVKCHDLEGIKASQGEINAGHDELKASQEKWNDEMKVEFTEVKDKISAIEKKQDEGKDEMKVELTKMTDKMTGIEGKQDRMQQSVDEMKQQFQTMMRMLNQALPGRNVKNNGAQVTDPRVSVNNQDVIIFGGYYAPGRHKVSNIVETLNIAEGKSTKLPQMKKPRAASASCVYNGDVIVTGGFDGQDGTDSIEILKTTQHPLRWTKFGGKLPVKLAGHSSIIYQNKLYVIGGYNWNEKRTSDIIYEVDLAPPYAVTLLARMYQARKNHRTEIVNGKLFILGGTTTGCGKVAIDSVVVYDFITKEFKTCPSLPKAVCDMSTITWGNMIIVVGGMDTNEQVLSDVIMYDTETGRNERLPSLKHKRCGCSAVIMDDVIAVLGGSNLEQKYLNSVESFAMGSDGWKELPGMKEKRSGANAVVIPRI